MRLPPPEYGDASVEPPNAPARVRRERVKFLKDICGVPEDALLDGSWAKWRDADGWGSMHHLAECVNAQKIAAAEYDDLMVDSLVWRFVRRGGDLSARVMPRPRAAGKTPLLMLCQVQTSNTARGEEHEAAIASLAECLLKWKADPFCAWERVAGGCR